MRINCTVEQIRKIRDDAFETAAKIAEDIISKDGGISDIGNQIRAMKKEPVTITWNS